MNILLVEDSRDLVELFSKAIHREGWQVTAAASVSEALAALEQQTFDLVLSDIGLPGQSGIDFIRTVRESEKSGQRITTIAVTAYDDLELDAVACGFDAHIRKPVSPADLIQYVKNSVAFQKMV